MKSLPGATWLNDVLKGTKPRIEPAATVSSAPHLPTTSAENLQKGGQVQRDSPKAQTTKIYFPEVSTYLILFQSTF